MSCVTAINYSVLINDCPGQAFKPSRGLRQGDHLSLNLFMLCAKGFSALLNVAEQQGKIIGLKVARRDISVNLR